MSFLQLYKLWSAGVASPPTKQPLPFPACTASDISLLVNVGYKGASLVHLNITGEEMLSPLLNHGTLEIELDGPAVLGKAEWAFTARDVENFAEYHYGLPIQCTSRDWTAFDASLHCFRRNDSAMACLLRADKTGHSDFGRPGRGGAHPLIKEGGQISKSCEFDLSKPSHIAGLAFPGEYQYARQVPPLRESQMANELLCRLDGKLVNFELRVRLRVVEPSLVEIYAVQVQVCWDEYNDHDFVDSTFVGSDDVTLLHIISELKTTSE